MSLLHVKPLPVVRPVHAVSGALRSGRMRRPGLLGVRPVPVQHARGSGRPTVTRPEPAVCAYCGRPGQDLEPCCDWPEHRDRLVCADVRGCMGVVLSVLHDRDGLNWSAWAGAPRTP
jgi:hypothetical protein